MGNGIENITTHKDSEISTELLTDSTIKQKDFNEYTAQTEKNFDKLTEEIKTIKDSVDNNPFGSSVGYISIVAVVLALLAVIIALIIKSITSGTINKIIKNFKNQSDTIDKLSDKVDKLEIEILKLKNDNQKKQPLFEENNVVNANLSSMSKNISSVSSINSMPLGSVNPQPVQLAEKWLNFVQDFNSLANQSGYEQKKASEEFLRKYNVQAFSCINFEARMNDPVPPPQFGAAPSLQNADYWAYEFETNTFAVVPKVKTYTDNHHSARAMGEVFDSNYQSGTYSKIRVEKPAIFKGMWNLEKSGKLELK